MTRARLPMLLVVLTGAAFGAVTGGAHASPADVKLPEAVDKSFKAQFPNAEIQKLTAEEENGVMVYDFEFKDGEAEKEADIAADGTLMEHTLVIRAEAVPEAAMKSIAKAAKGATIGRIERIEISDETRGGKVVKLSKPMTRYAAEMTKGKKMAEVIVNTDGTVVESPEWTELVPEAAPSPAPKPSP